MRETDESIAALVWEADVLRRQAANIATFAAAAAAGDGAFADASFVRDVMDAMRGRVDRVEAQLLARIPSVRP
jgi:hypothetical protein